MIPEDVLPHLVTVLRSASATDRYGNSVDDWTAATRQDAWAWLQLTTGSEVTDQRNAQIGDWLLVCNPVDVDGNPLTVDGRSRIEWGTTTFEVKGPPGPAHTPSELHHYEVLLRVVEG